jgi:rod shape determining protein RodA
MFSSPSTNWRYFDFWLLGSVAVLSIFGIAMIRSTIAGNIDLAGYDHRQIVFVVLGLLVILFTAAIDYRLWAAVSRPIYIAMFLLLAVLYVVGRAVFGSARWFETAYFSIQPSELAKIIIILSLADFFTRHQSEVHRLDLIARSLVYTSGILIWILLQPNLGTSIVILVIWFALLWASGLRLKHLALFILAGVSVPVLAYPFLEDYQQQRILNFLFPDPNAPHGELYNLQQALVSIGSGGWFGQGYNSATQVQLRFLKVRHSDFIFSSLSSEFGFIGTTIVILVLVFVVWRCLHLARQARDTFGALICYGVATLIAFQAMVNIGVNLQLLPATGLPLPFISYGGSSLLSLMLGIGLVESVAIRQKILEL